MGNLTYKYLGTAKHARQTKRSRLWQDAQPTDCLALAAISLFAQRALRGVPDDYQWPGDSKTRKQVRLGCPAAWWQVCKSGQHLRQRVGSPRKQQSLVPSKNPETRGKLKWSFSRQQESTDNHGNRWKRKTSNRQPGYRQFICKKSAIFPLCWSMFRLPFVGLNFAKVCFSETALENKFETQCTSIKLGLGIAAILFLCRFTFATADKWFPSIVYQYIVLWIICVYPYFACNFCVLLLGPWLSCFLRNISAILFLAWWRIQQNMFPGHERQMCVGSPVSSQGRKAAVLWQVNRWTIVFTHLFVSSINYQQWLARKVFTKTKMVDWSAARNKTWLSFCW